MPDQRPQRHRQLIDYLRALADRLEAQEQADQQTEAEARRIRDWMRTVNRKGKIGAVALAVWALERPWRASALAAAVGGGVALAVVGLPWANGEEGTLPMPPSVTDSPAATDSPSPTADTTSTATPTLSPAATPEALETPEPAADPVAEAPPASRTAGPPSERDRGSPPESTSGQSPKPSPEPSGPGCVLPLRVELPSLAEVDVCVLPR